MRTKEGQGQNSSGILEEGVKESAMSEGESKVVLAPKNEEKLHLCVD